jgi:histidine triad (HIT) family protein
MAQTCVFCSIVSGTLPAAKVYEDERHIAFFPLEQIHPGHLLLIPKHHIDYLFDISEPDYLDLWRVAAHVAAALRDVSGAKRIGVAVEGFAVPHAHIHLVPVNAGNELNPTRAIPGDSEERNRLAVLLRTALDA